MEPDDAVAVDDAYGGPEDEVPSAAPSPEPSSAPPVRICDSIDSSPVAAVLVRRVIAERLKRPRPRAGSPASLARPSPVC